MKNESHPSRCSYGVDAEVSAVAAELSSFGYVMQGTIGLVEPGVHVLENGVEVIIDEVGNYARHIAVVDCRPDAVVAGSVCYWAHRSSLTGCFLRFFPATEDPSVRRVDLYTVSDEERQDYRRVAKSVAETLRLSY